METQLVMCTCAGVRSQFFATSRITGFIAIDRCTVEGSVSSSQSSIHSLINICRATKLVGPKTQQRHLKPGVQGNRIYGRSEMALRPFSFPSPETRFFTADSLIYNEDEILQEGGFDKELEEIVRAVLGNLDCLQPFSTQHFIIFPCILSFTLFAHHYKKSWGKVCKHDAKKLSYYPFAIILYLEKNTFRGNQREKIKEMQLIPTFSDEPRPKRSRGDSPLEDAIIKQLMKDMEAEGSKSITGSQQRMTGCPRNQGFSSNSSERSSRSSSDLLKIKQEITP
ncbi:hypothetical protein CCH79_00011628 [Gambusia affinis]|uniref:Uncharacterized protein n=1 Tax=Gambusia affinis TaxID=33528 RepID=A0A315VVA2_GAMAF|nr:hypothetical protein CCH79_00011628 [Gambusia affinis]